MAPCPAGSVLGVIDERDNGPEDASSNPPGSVANSLPVRAVIVYAPNGMLSGISNLAVRCKPVGSVNRVLLAIWLMVVVTSGGPVWTSVRVTIVLLVKCVYCPVTCERKT